KSRAVPSRRPLVARSVRRSIDHLKSRQPHPKYVGITYPTASLMQKRNTGKADARCVCLLWAQEEGVTSAGTQPSPSGMLSPPVQFLGGRDPPAHAGVSRWDAGLSRPKALHNLCNLFVSR